MKKRHLIVTSGVLALVVIAVSAAIDPVPRLIWNASVSVPIGYYSVTPVDDLRVDDLLVVQPPPDISRYLEQRGLMPKDVPLLKHVAALPGQTVCRHGFVISVDGIVIGEARFRDSRGRILPLWYGCHKLGQSQIFLMNTAVPDSLDGRYFGPFDRSTIVGQAAPLWIDADGDGRFIWHGSCNFLAPSHPQKENDDVTYWIF